MSDWKKDLRAGLEAWKQSLPQMRVDSNQAVKRVTDFLESMEDTTTVVVFGEFKAGKSMFINAFLGEELSVSAATPTTAVTTEIKYGPERKLHAVFQNGNKQEVDLAMFKELSTEHEGRLKAVRRQLDHLIIETPIEQLKEITIIDTPGFNAGNEHHDEMSKKFLGHGDYAIWIFHHNQVGTPFEKDTLMTLHESDMKVFGVVNAIDMHNEEDEETLENFMEYQRRQFQGLLESLTPVSSKEALQAKKEKNHEMLEFSGWKAVESLFKEMELSDEEKMERTLKKFVTVLKDAECLLSSEKQTVPIHYYRHIIQTFTEEQMPELIQLFDKFHTRRISIQAELIKLEALLSIPLDSEESIEKHDGLFNDMNEQHPFQRVTSFDWKGYRDLYIVIDAFNTHIRELEFDRNRISAKWGIANGKAFFKKILLERLLMRQREYNHVVQKANSEWMILNQRKNEMDALIDAYFQELKEELLFTYRELLNELMEMGQFWSEEWKELEKELHKIPEEQEQAIKRLESIMKAYQSSIVPFFKSTYEEMTQNEIYQEAYYKSQVIETMYPEMPMEQFGQSKNLFYSIEHLKSIQPVNVVHKNFIFQPLLNRSISFVPPVLALPFEAEIEKIKAFRKKMVLILGMIFLIVIGVWKIDFSSIFDREPEVSHAQDNVSTPYEDIEFQNTTALPPDEEVVFDFLAWDEQSVIQFITDIHFLMQTGDVSELKTMFSSEGWQSYSAVYDQLHTYNQSAIQQVVLNTINKDQLIFSTIETLNVDGVNMQYDNQYTLSHPENPIIEFFSSELVQQDIQADEYALGLFMKNYRDAYMNAINQGEFTLVEGYFLADGAVYREIKEYIHEMSKDDVHFDFGQTEVTGMERIGPDRYIVQTMEDFLFTDAQGGKTQYEKRKDYTVRLFSESDFQIESIQTIKSKNEKIIEDTVFDVPQDEIEAFIKDYFNNLVRAMNERDLTHVESYYSPNGNAYQDVRIDLEAMSSQEIVTLRQLNLDSVVPYDEQHVRVSFYVEMEHEMDGTALSTDIFNQQLLVNTEQNGHLEIVEILSTNIME